MKGLIAVGLIGLSLAACAKGEAIRTSATTMLVTARADPDCGAEGAARVASDTAAIETIKAGYDRYVIVDGAASNNVHATQLPGSFRTEKMFSGSRTIRTTTYVPGAIVQTGKYNQQLSVQMFRDGEPGAAQAIPARESLGPNWAQKVRDGVSTCL